MMLHRWREQGVLSGEQFALLDGLFRREPFSVFLELNVLLYAGVAAFIGGLTWTVQTYAHQLGDTVVLTFLSAIFLASLWYCFSRGPGWSAAETVSPNLVFDYVLYLGSLTWTVELAYLETRFHLLSGQWDTYLLSTAGLFFALAYRFDNRFVLSLALSALAGWFGLRISHWPGSDAASYRNYAVLFSLITGAGGLVLRRLAIKAHFFQTYLHVAANVLFIAVLSGVFNREGYTSWFVILLAASGVSLTWGLRQRQFAFVSYATLYGYAGISSILLRNVSDSNTILAYFIVTGILMLVLLAGIARRSGREA
jgi:hypothetical protein